ncbi:hypothetical protein [Chryseobacterium koreense]
MKRLFIPAIMAVAIVASCEKKNEQAENVENTTTTEQVAENHDHHATSDEHATTDEHSTEGATLELDNGKKWKTNAEMLPFINEQEKLLKNYDHAKGDYQKLAANLASANDKLVQSCTMTGKSHDVLHVWLNDHLQFINQLKNAANKEEAEQTIAVLDNSMAKYHTYFE